jgi:hypothetical protein
MVRLFGISCGVPLRMMRMVRRAGLPLGRRVDWLLDFELR